MEHDKKQGQPVREQQRDRVLVNARAPLGTAGQVRVPLRPSVSALAPVAEACFDLQLDEKHGARPSRAPGSLAALAGLEQLIAIVGRCLIPGCDVHFLSRELDIITHIEATSPIDAALARARSYWASPHPAAVAVLVYTDRTRILLVDGTELPLG
jgi:hypothetical protein